MRYNEHDLAIGNYFSDGGKKIYKVNHWSLTNDGTWYDEEGMPHNASDARVEIYERDEEGKLVIENERRLYLHLVEGLSITPENLSLIGFQDDVINGYPCLRFRDLFFTTLQEPGATQTMYGAEERYYPVRFIHQVQKVMNHLYAR